MKRAAGDSIVFGGGDGGRVRRPSGLGGWLLVFSAVGGFAACYDLATRDVAKARAWGEAVPEAQVGREEYGGIVWGLAYSPDGARLAVATIDGALSLKDVATGRSAALQDGPSGSARVLAFSPDGRTLAAGGQSAAVRLWDVATCREREPLRVQGERVDGLAFSPDGARLTVGRWNGPLADWDWRRGRPGDAPSFPFGGLIRFAAAPDGRTVAVGDAHGRVVVLGRSGVLWVSAGGRPTPVTALAFSPDGSALAAASLYDPEARVYDAAGGALRYTAGKGHLGVTALAFSSDGSLLATADLDGKARLYDAKEGHERGSVSAGRALYSVALSPDGTTLVTGDHGGSVRYWSLERVLAARRRAPGDGRGGASRPRYFEAKTGAGARMGSTPTGRKAVGRDGRDHSAEITARVRPNRATTGATPSTEALGDLRPAFGADFKYPENGRLWDGGGQRVVPRSQPARRIAVMRSPLRPRPGVTPRWTIRPFRPPHRTRNGGGFGSECGALSVPFCC